MANDITLEAAARWGDINCLYTLIQEDPRVLERVDEIPFVDTPLHIAASAGHLQFSMEIMGLKPLFARRLNQQGFSPIHLALQHGRKKLVLRFVDNEKNLVRVKGRECLTPLHFVCQTGDIDLLAAFLEACPQSIEDVTIRSETALHIAMKYGQLETFKVLAGWLRRTTHKGAGVSFVYSILNHKDEAGNTIMHLAANNGHVQALDILINNELSTVFDLEALLDLDAKNSENSTALDIAASAEIESKLLKAGAKRASSVKDDPALEDKLRSKIIGVRGLIQTLIPTFIRRFIGSISYQERDAYFVVATLVVTAIYQTALSPPGGVYQADNGANNLKATSTPFFTSSATTGNTGKSVMLPYYFFCIYGLNTIAFVIMVVAILMLTPREWVGLLAVWPTTLCLAFSYFNSLLVISPSPFTECLSVIAALFLSLLGVLWFYILLKKSKVLFRMYVKMIKRSIRRNMGHR